MLITVQLPDDLSAHPNPGREALEALVLEGYRTGTLSHRDASEMLGLDRFAFDGLLKDRQVFEHAYDVDDLERDIETNGKLRAKGLIPA